MSTARRWQLVLWTLVAALAGATFVVSGRLIMQGERDALARSEGRAVRFLHGAEAGLNRLMLGVDALLAGASAMLAPASRPDGTLDTAMANRLLFDMAGRNLLVRDVAVLASDGRLLASAQPSSQRIGVDLPKGFLAEVLGQTVPQMAISVPVVSFGTSERVVYFARPLKLAAARGAVVVAEVPVSLIGSVFGQVAEMGGLVGTLERNDGLLMASVPADERLLGQKLAPPLDEHDATGKPLRMASRLGGAPAIVALRPTLYRSLMVAASIPLEAALAGWHAQRRGIAGAAAAFVALLLSTGAVIHVLLSRLAQARTRAARAEGALEEALASLAAGFLLCDGADRVVAWNPRYEEIYPWLRQTLAPGVPFRRLAEAMAPAMVPQGSDEDRRAWVERRLAVHQSGRGAWRQQLAHGMMVQVLERGTGEGGVVSVVCNVTAADRSLARARAQALAADESKSQLVTSLAREIRVPLHGVIGTSGMLLNTPLSADQRRFAEAIRGGGQGLLALVNDMLDSAQWQARRMALELEDFDPAGTLDDVVSQRELRAHAKGLALTLSMPPDLPELLRGDAVRLRQVLLELVDNAISFTERGQVDLHAEHRGLEDGRVELAIAVRDSGIGIAPEALSQLFDLVMPLDGITPRANGMAGPGLAVCRELVGLMGGRIEVESATGVGSTFTVVIAMARGEQPAPPPEGSVYGTSDPATAAASMAEQR